MKTQIQILKSNDLEELNELLSVFEVVFEMKGFVRPGKMHLQNLLKKDTFIAVTAKVGSKVVAGLTLYLLDQYYSKKPLAYLYDLAVLTDYQRQGIGKSLIEFSLSYCRENNFEEVFVQADKVDDYAIDFYRSTKPTNEEEVVHFDYKLSNE